MERMVNDLVDLSGIDVKQDSEWTLEPHFIQNDVGIVALYNLASL